MRSADACPSAGHESRCDGAVLARRLSGRADAAHFKLALDRCGQEYHAVLQALAGFAIADATAPEPMPWLAVGIDALIEWECGEARRARRQQQGAPGSRGVPLDGVTWVIPAGPPRLAVTAAGLDHRLPCWGYVFHEHDEPLAAAGADRAQVQEKPLIAAWFRDTVRCAAEGHLYTMS